MTDSKTCNQLATDAISRQEAIDILDAYQVMVENGEKNPYSWARLRMSELPSAQPEPAIPLSWIETHIEWLKGLDNAFSILTAVQISTMVKKWKDEQDD